MKILCSFYSVVLGLFYLGCTPLQKKSTVIESNLEKMTLVYIDSLILESHYFIKFITTKGDSAIIFSKKENRIQDPKIYTKLFTGNTYKLNLNRVRSTNKIVPDLNFRLPFPDNIYVDEKLLFPQNHAIYECENLAGIYYKNP